MKFAVEIKGVHPKAEKDVEAMVRFRMKTLLREVACDKVTVTRTDQKKANKKKAA